MVGRWNLPEKNGPFSGFIHVLIFREYVSLVGRSTAVENLPSKMPQALTFLSSIVGGHLSYLRVRGVTFSHSLTIPIKSPELPGLGIMYIYIYIYQFAQMDVRDVRDVFFVLQSAFFSLVRVCQINMMGVFTVLSVERNNDFILSMFGVFKIQRDQWTAKKYIQLHDTVWSNGDRQLV